MRCWFSAGGKRLRLAPECGLRSRTDWTRACRALTQRKPTKQSAMRCSSTCTNRTWVTAGVRTRKQRRGMDLSAELALLASAFPESAEELLGAAANGKMYVFCDLAPDLRDCH